MLQNWTPMNCWTPLWMGTPQENWTPSSPTCLSPRPVNWTPHSWAHYSPFWQDWTWPHGWETRTGLHFHTGLHTIFDHHGRENKTGLQLKTRLHSSRTFCACWLQTILSLTEKCFREDCLLCKNPKIKGPSLCNVKSVVYECVVSKCQNVKITKIIMRSCRRLINKLGLS